MFSKYAALVKNMRGVIVLDLKEELHPEVLKRRFRYRNVGVPPALFRQKPDFFRAEPFVELAYPVSSLQKLSSLVETEFRVPEFVAEAAVLASAYVSPILLLGKNAVRLLKPLSVECIESRIKPDPRSLKLHLRIADYSVLDLYRWSIENAMQLWERKKALAGLKNERKKQIKRDRKRYWRLQNDDVKPVPFIYYIDLVQHAISNSGFMAKVIKLPAEEVCAGLAILTAVVLDV